MTDTAVTIHCLDDARAVLRAAKPGETVRLRSALGAAGHQGIGWWQALVGALAEEFPDTPFTAELDCGDSPGLALAALTAGVAAVRVHALRDDVRHRLEDIARQCGAELLDKPAIHGLADQAHCRPA